MQSGNINPTSIPAGEMFTKNGFRPVLLAAEPGANARTRLTKKRGEVQFYGRLTKRKQSRD